MADKKQDPSRKRRAPSVEPLVLPDVANQQHPTIEINPVVPAADKADDEAAIPADIPEDAPVGDYARQIQMEFEEQEEEGKV